MILHMTENRTVTALLKTDEGTGRFEVQLTAAGSGAQTQQGGTIESNKLPNEYCDFLGQQS